MRTIATPGPFGIIFSPVGKERFFSTRVLISTTAIIEISTSIMSIASVIFLCFSMFTSLEIIGAGQDSGYSLLYDISVECGMISLIQSFPRMLQPCSA
jgi:hypothetical protein